MGMFEKSFTTGVVIGVAGTMLAKEVLPGAQSIAKPVAKSAVKGAMIGYQKIRELFARTGEAIEDMTAEARMEISRFDEEGEEAQQPKRKAQPEVEDRDTAESSRAV
jgi:hypothetical protein